MNVPVPATSAEIASIRRRYLWMATSIFFLDFAIIVIFMAATDTWLNAWRSAGIGVLLLLGVNWLTVRHLFEPVRCYLDGKIPFEDIQRRLTQLPLLTAQTTAILTFTVWAFRLSVPFWADSSADIPKPTIGDFVATMGVLTIFYFSYTYFVVSDYLANLCTFIFRHYGRNLSLFFGSYTIKLLVALLVISIGPLAAILADLFSYEAERLQVEILIDVASAAMGVAIMAYFISRSLLRPLHALSSAMTKVADGDLSLRVPVTSNDDVGELTGQFNNMVEGLRERERIRETFGRYVDESVASTILHREGQGVLAGETREATILFTDIAGFTTIAEYLAPDRLVTALNEYLETVLEPIRAHGGVVNTFIGDGLFASFNMPLACENHGVAAVRAAIDIQRAVGARTFGDEGVAFATRIGISTGHVIGGSVGAGQRMSFTLLGDTVNLASRLEELNKQHGTRILVSESTCTACNGEFAFAALGSVTVRGRSDVVAIFSIDPNSQGKPS
ncbi:MAG: adenylate/guanylate cyclase domain-containing protein [Reyranella sp.]|uniref:adenylate/guanylate cyclase domain-containing protein n=1 Tax=Reyranella sp. TaxID=1929291 RepID=UPI0012126C5F|nr:adenylate/guanylate cyclase domain-containing protein [Reyranella sp.]TAJ42153.1 MAG: adenylate/guanylate cyclase domain-containing protein [Reyranella sp.]